MRPMFHYQIKGLWLSVLLTNWECSEGAGSLHGPYAGAAFIDIDSMDIISIDDGCADECTEYLRKNVTRNFLPREFSPDGKRQRDLE